MEKESEKMDRILNLLRESKPILDSCGSIEREVIKKILASRNKTIGLSDILEFIFGWVYIGWVRRSLITASVILVLIFIYQQGIILNQIKILSNQIIVNERADVMIPGKEFGKKLLMLRLTGTKITSKDIVISEQQLDELFESVKEMQDKYKELLNLIEEDAEIKKLIEQKVIENSNSGSKL